MSLLERECDRCNVVEKMKERGWIDTMMIIFMVEAFVAIQILLIGLFLGWWS